MSPALTGREHSLELEERRRMKGSTYETGLGRARSGRKGVQRLGEGPSLPVRHGEDERKPVSKPGFSLLRNMLWGEWQGSSSGKDKVVVGRGGNFGHSEPVM